MSAAEKNNPIRRIYDLCRKLLTAIEEFDRLFERPLRADSPLAIAALLRGVDELRGLLEKHRPRIVRALDQREPSQVFNSPAPTTPDALVQFVDRVAVWTAQIEWRGTLSRRGEEAHNNWCEAMRLFRSEHDEVKARLRLESVRIAAFPADSGMKAPPKGRAGAGQSTYDEFAQRYGLKFSTLTDRRYRHNQRNPNDKIEPIDTSLPLVFRDRDLERLLHPTERARRVPRP